MSSYLKGKFKSIFKKNVSGLAMITSDCDIDPTAVVCHGVKLRKSSLGRYSYVSSGTDMTWTQTGSFCSIADRCRIGLPSHELEYLSTSPLFTLKRNALKRQWAKKSVDRKNQTKVIIGNDVWIGSHALIKHGIKIGDGAVIGAGAVVTHDVAPYSIVGGVPAKLIRWRFSEEVIAKLLQIKWWDFDDQTLKDNIDLFQSKEINLDKLESLAMKQDNNNL